MAADALTGILIKYLTREQLDVILQAVSDELGLHGQCPLCDMEDVPVTKRGKEIKGEDVSKAWEWRERHDEDCPVMLIEQSFSKRKKAART